MVNKTWETLASNDENVCGENDLVIVNHDNADIEDVGYSDYSLESETAISNLKQTEYRYCGSNPDNYVTFNDEDAGWRIIGLVNTPDGQRIKLIKTSSIGYYSFDNFGDYGLNDWTRSSLQNILNNGAYYNRTTGDCPSGKNGSTITCNFETNGLKDSAKLMIDENIIWNLGGYNFLVDNDPEGTTDNFYSHERGKELYSGKSTLWKGNGVGLMYPSDYGYATNGGDIGRKTCLNYSLFIWNNYSSCFDSESNWLYKKGEIWTLTSNSIYSGTLLIPTSSGRINNWDAVSRNIVYPVVYLKPNIKIISGTGEIDNPYILSD